MMKERDDKKREDSDCALCNLRNDTGQNHQETGINSGASGCES